MAKERDCQRALDSRSEPDPDERNWRETRNSEPPLEGENLYDQLIEDLRKRRQKRMGK